MQGKQGYQRKLKNKYTSDTQITQEEINPSKIRNRSDHLQVFKSGMSQKMIRGEISEELNYNSITPTLTKNLLEVPSLTKRREEPSIFDSKNVQSISNSLNTTHKEVKTRSGQIKEEAINAYLLTSLNGNSSNIKYSNKEGCRQQNGQQKVVESHLSSSEVKRRIQQKHQLASEKNFGVKKYGSLGNIMLDSPIQNSNIQINISRDVKDCQPIMVQSSKNQRKIIQFDRQKVKLSPGYIKEQAKRLKYLPKGQEVSSHQKITLKDYLYRTQLTSQKAMKKKRNSINNVVSKDKICKLDHNSSKKINLEKKMSTLTTNYRSEKYEVTNSKMYSALKHEIMADIGAAMVNFRRLEKILENLQPVSEPSNSELAGLYHTRRIMKDQVNPMMEFMQEQLARQIETIAQQNQLVSGLLGYEDDFINI